MKINQFFRIRGGSTGNLIFWLLILVHLIPLWSVPYFPSQDGPVHLENAVILGAYNDPGKELIRHFYYLNTADPSNWLIQLVLSVITLVFPPLIALKVLISGYIILFPVSFRYCLTTFSSGSGFMSFLAFPFIYNYTLHMGFLGFCFSLLLFFFLLGTWIKFKTKQNLKTGIIISSLILITYLLHIVSTVMAVVAIFLLIMLEYIHNLYLGKQMIPDTHYKSHLRFLLFTCLPTLVVLLLFLLRQNAGITYSSALTDRLLQLVTLTSLYSFVRSELLLSCSLAFLIFLLSVFLIGKRWRNRQLLKTDLLLAIVISYVLVYFAAPDTIAGGEVINARLLLYPYFILIIWLGTHTWRNSIRYTILLTATTISLLYLGLHTKNYREINELIEEYVSVVDLVEEQTVLLPLSFYAKHPAPAGALTHFRINPFIHLSSYLAIEKDIVELDNYQGWQRHFPVQYRAHLNPMEHLAVDNQLESIPPKINILTYYYKSGISIDYVLIWGLEDTELSQPGAKAILRQLEQGYALIFQSAPRKNLRLYRSEQRNPYQTNEDHLTNKIF
jgi:hypothetical protein